VCLFSGCEFPGQRRAAETVLFIDLLGNSAVFVPLGAALAAATLPQKSNRSRRRRLDWRWWACIAAIGFLFSLGIEIAQLFIPTRATDVDDLILNTTGALLGAVVFSLLITRYRGTP
jgi:glycopeptide antibiotics resistance protein